MSKFTGVTFSKQKVTPSDDAIIRRAILPDGKLTGCDITYSGSTLTMSSGQLIVCGRQIRHPSAENWSVVDASSGFARLVLTIDLTRTATKETFDQVVTAIEYASSENGFVDLEQSDINTSGARYQVVICVVSLGAGGITGIVSQLEKSAADGSGSVNFKVVGGLTQPADPKENTIWVQTETKITSWQLSPSAPASPKSGMVWIKTGESGPRELNVLKKNGIIIYPLSAAQYISGTWTSVTAMSYQNGSWENWLTYLYNHGDECKHLTGGWTATALKSSQHTTVSAKAPTITRNGDSIKATVSSGGGVFHCDEKIDLTDFKTLTILGTFTRTGEQSRNLMAGCWKEFGSYYDDGNGVADAYAKLEGSSGTELVVDVSALSGLYIVGIGITSSTATVTEVLLT